MLICFCDLACFQAPPLALNISYFWHCFIIAYFIDHYFYFPFFCWRDEDKQKYKYIYIYIRLYELLKSKEFLVAVLFVPIDLTMTKKRNVNSFINYSWITRDLEVAPWTLLLAPLVLVCEMILHRPLEEVKNSLLPEPGLPHQLWHASPKQDVTYRAQSDGMLHMNTPYWLACSAGPTL